MEITTINDTIHVNNHVGEFQDSQYEKFKYVYVAYTMGNLPLKTDTEIFYVINFNHIVIFLIVIMSYIIVRIKKNSFCQKTEKNRISGFSDLAYYFGVFCFN